MRKKWTDKERLDYLEVALNIFFRLLGKESSPVGWLRRAIDDVRSGARRAAPVKRGRKGER